MDVIELSTGHVFVPGSVKAIGPLINNTANSQSGWVLSFEVLGVGFKAVIAIPFSDFDNGSDDDGEYGAALEAFKAAAPRVRQEAIDKLLGGNGA